MDEMFVSFLLLLLAPAHGAIDSIATQCEYYNSTCLLAEGAPNECAGVEACPSKDTPCYVVWNHGDNQTKANGIKEEHQHKSGFSVSLMGCFPDAKHCDPESVCLDDSPKDTTKTHRFCCCTGEMCNAKFKWVPQIDEVINGERNGVKDNKEEETETLVIAVVASVCFLILVLVVVVSVVYKMRKAARSMLQANEEGCEMLTGGAGASGGFMPEPKMLEKPVDLLEIKAQGRFGCVWKGKIENGLVAVKVFPLQEKQSWYAEYEVYNLPRIAHENILKFIGVDKKGENLDKDYWLMTEFHANGSLYDYLKANSVTWAELCKIAYSMACGLAHLHKGLPAKGTQDMKLPVAHRDFKSKNVLIKSDLTACIGDFGLALIFKPGPIGDTHGQVGTRRYMAPEVLEGAISFTQESFLSIDMYACGLVLWELATRCHMPGIEPKEYKLPFEEDAPRPTLERMQELVVSQKKRPQILDCWQSHRGLADLSETIRDCWDQDADARLPASNVKERLRALTETVQQQENNPRTLTEHQLRERQLNMTNVVRTSQTGADQTETMPLIINNSVNANGNLNV